MEKLEFITKKSGQLFEQILEYRRTLNYSMLQTLLRKRDIKVNDKRISSNINTSSGDKITLFLNDKKQKNIQKLFEDKNIIVAVKPQGLEVTKKDKAFLDSDSLEEILHATACHRLDKNTEGIVIFAKNKEAETALTQAFKEHNIQKKYYVIVSGKVKPNLVTLENYLKKYQNYAKICKKTEKNAKFAKLSYKVIKQKDDLFLLEVDLFTGRFHQIRAQLSNQGIFVLGDEKYGNKAINKKYHTTKQQLCAYFIQFGNLQKPVEYLSQKTFTINPAFSIDNFDIKK